MIEDVYYFKQEHFNLANKIYNDLVFKKNFNIIGIGGVSGSAKSEISTILSNKLNDIGVWTRVLSLDGYYVVSPENREKCRKETGIIGEKEINWPEVQKFVYEHRHYATIIIEGLYALFFNVDYGIFINRSLEQTYEFRKERGKENPDTEWRKYVLEKECEAVLKTKEKADLIV